MQEKSATTTKRRNPPTGYVTAGEAERILGNKMLYKYTDKQLVHTVNSPIRGQKFYRRSDLEAIRGSNDALFERGVSVGIKNKTKFSRATPDDMNGVYEVARELFSPRTTSAEDRKQFVTVCPDGNYIVTESDEIRAFIHIQPVKKDPLKRFLKGEIIGRDIKASDLEQLEAGKPVDLLIKSMGATEKFGEEKHRHYIQRLFLGVSAALAELGRQGIIIRKFYTTSETEASIALSLHAGMKTIRRLKSPNLKTHEPGRYAFELDVSTSDLPLLRPYKEALATWKEQHP